MQSFPHLYRTRATGGPHGEVNLEASDLPRLEIAPPAEFDGPGDRWSPETLMSGAIASCFILTFRAVARASGLDWTDLVCEVEGTLDRIERETRFTEVRIRAFLEVPTEVPAERARRILEKSERSCLITSSLTARVHFEPHVHSLVPT